MPPFFCARFDLGLLLGLLLRVTLLASLGLLLGSLFRFFECASEIGNLARNANKCRFSTFSERKNDTYFVLTPYYNKLNTLDR